MISHPEPHPPAGAARPSDLRPRSVHPPGPSPSGLRPGADGERDRSNPDPPSFPLLRRFAERVREHPDGEHLLAQLLGRPPEGRR